MTFKNAVLNTPVIKRTDNGMKAYEDTLNFCVSLFYKIGASRGKNLTAEFERAYQEDRERAIRVALWARDIRKGAGERKMFRDLLQYLEKNHKNDLLETKILNLVPELGRWDDLLVFEDKAVKTKAYDLIKESLDNGNGLASKWLPRKGPIAVELREHFGWSPKFYRKRLVELTNVVEQLMCAKKWEDIDFNKVPSLAMTRYLKAFHKNAEDGFSAWKAALESKDPEVAKTVKVNASAVYPHDVVRALRTGQKSVANAMWDALPNYMNNAAVLPVVDVSGSMLATVAGAHNVTCLDVAISLGLYCASKNTGAFSDLFLTFSDNSKFNHLKGSLNDRYNQLQRADWGMSTNIHSSFNEILRVAIANDVKVEDMPKILLILSDMQFNSCIRYDDSAMEMIRRKYQEAGYETPNIVFWNLRDAGNTPVSFNEKGAALVSGFSPSILEAILSGNFEEFTPKAIMDKKIMSDRYSFA